MSELSAVCCDSLFVQIAGYCNWRGRKLSGSVPGMWSCGCSSLAADGGRPVTLYITSWHSKNDIFCCVYLLAKRGGLENRKSKTERDSSRLGHAKYINISIWCLILHPLPLTPLASVALIAELEWALPGQGHVAGVCYQSATWSQRCLWGPGAPACWQGGSSECCGKLTGSKAVLRNLGHTCTHTSLCSWLYFSLL